jgi:signal transduction histidine kinase
VASVRRFALEMDRRERMVVPVAAVCAVVTVVAGRHPTTRIAVAALMVAVMAGLLAARRLPPGPALAALLVTAACSLAALVLVPNGIAEVPFLSATALVPTVTVGRLRAVVVLACSAAFGAGIWYASGSLFGLLAAPGAWLLAERTVERADLERERDRAVALLAEVEASRDAAARAAATEERSRIAREMHDVLAHSLAGLSLQLQAVRAVAARHGVPPEVTDPLDRAAQLAREGVAEARAAVGALRPAEGLGLDALPALVERFPGQATLAVTGEPGTVTAAAGHAAYRAVQEGLTNAARYAPGSPVTVTVRWSPAELAVEVADRGRPAGREPSGVQGSGAGIAGMAERVAAAGGTLRAGPAGDGWTVALSLPAAPGADRLGSVAP